MLNSDREYTRSQNDNEVLELFGNADTTGTGLILCLVIALLSLFSHLLRLLIHIRYFGYPKEGQCTRDLLTHYLSKIH
jgi:hypothetical protein